MTDEYVVWPRPIRHNGEILAVLGGAFLRSTKHGLCDGAPSALGEMDSSLLLRRSLWRRRAAAGAGDEHMVLQSLPYNFFSFGVLCALVPGRVFLWWFRVGSRECCAVICLL